MKPLACEARFPPPLLRRPPRPRFPLNWVIVFLTVSKRAPEPDVRRLPPR